LESDAGSLPSKPPLKISKKAVIKARFADQVRFFGSVLRAPRTTGAVAPTSSETATLMASHIDTSSGLPVLELGPGTGAITRAILATGLPQDRLFAIEYSDRFCRMLREEWPRANIVQGDAFSLRETLGANAPGAFDTVISGLPLLNFPKEMRISLLDQALDLLAPGRPFVQFSYGVSAPVKAVDRRIRISRTPWVLKNVPPARVWIYRRSH
jgi:phosphatidylethanolamine/phosphatidyl-N-methylethanolamine N-methyltransferase